MAILIVVLLVATSAAETLSGRCIAVADRDTITILTPAKRQVRVRLACIDCLERRQPFSESERSNSPAPWSLAGGYGSTS